MNRAGRSIAIFLLMFSFLLGAAGEASGALPPDPGAGQPTGTVVPIAAPSKGLASGSGTAPLGLIGVSHLPDVKIPAPAETVHDPGPLAALAPGRVFEFAGREA